MKKTTNFQEGLCMNISKFTQKSMEAVERCQKLALEYGNHEIEVEHLLYCLLTIEDSLILKLIEKMGIQKEHFVNRAEEAVAKRVKVQGGQVYVGKDLNVVLTSAEDEAKQMGDEYVSVEHLFLSMIRHPNKEIKAVPDGLDLLVEMMDHGQEQMLLGNVIVFHLLRLVFHRSQHDLQVISHINLVARHLSALCDPFLRTV